MNVLLWILFASVVLNCALRLWNIRLDRILAREEERLRKLERRAAAEREARSDV